MSTKPQHCPSFFKVLTRDFSHKLHIPPAFVKELKWKFPCASILKTSCGGSWEVEIQELVGQKYCFADGWLEFINFHKLQQYDLLVFRLIDVSVFQVTIFDPSCCEKKLHQSLPTDNFDTKFQDFEKGCYTDCMKESCSNTKNQEKGTQMKNDDGDADNDDGENVEKEEEDDGHGNARKANTFLETEDPCFTITMKKTHERDMFLPLRFVRETGIATKRATVLRDSQGKLWPMGIKTLDKIRVYLKYGWTDFRKAHDLKRGDKCMFKYIRNESNLFEVQVSHRVKSDYTKKRGAFTKP